MGNISLKEKLKSFIASMGWKLFLWGNSFTQEEYWKLIYEQESYRDNNLLPKGEKE